VIFFGATMNKPLDRYEFLKKKTEILGILQIMGPTGAMDAFCDFCNLAEQGIRKDASFDGKRFHESFGRLNYCLCCEIHGETPKKQANEAACGPLASAEVQRAPEQGSASG
jgi:hypothetical protein